MSRSFGDDCDHRGREPRMRADVHDDLGVANAADQLSFAIGAALGVDRHVAEFAKGELGGGAGEGRREVVGDDDTRRGHGGKGARAVQGA